MIMHRTEDDLHANYADPPVDPGAVNRLTHQIAELRAPRRGRRWMPVTAGIAVLVLIGGGATLLHSQNSPASETAAASAPSTSTQVPHTSAPAPVPDSLAGKIMLQRFIDLLPRPGKLTQFVDLSHGGSPGPVQVVYDDGHGAVEIIVGMYPSATGCSPCANRAGDTCSTRPDGTQVRIHQGPEYPNGHTPNATTWSVDILRPDKIAILIHEWNAPTEKGSPPSRAVPPFTIDELTTIATDPSWTPTVPPQLAARAATLYVPES